MLIGITGGIGSGKSTIARELNRLGFSVYYTDDEAKRIITSNPKIRGQIEALLGKDVFEGNKYLPKTVAQKVFGCPELLSQLNQIVHPAVAQDVKYWADKQTEICFVESAILFESKLNLLCDKTIAVLAPVEIRLMRTMQRDNSSFEKIRARMKSQLSDEELRSMADMYVVNDGAKTIQDLTQEICIHLSLL